MEINLKITVTDEGTIITYSNVDFGNRKQDLNLSVIMIGALEMAKSAIVSDRFGTIDERTKDVREQKL